MHFVIGSYSIVNGLVDKLRKKAYSMSSVSNHYMFLLMFLDYGFDIIVDTLCPSCASCASDPLGNAYRLQPFV